MRTGMTRALIAISLITFGIGTVAQNTKPPADGEYTEVNGLRISSEGSQS